ncbi:hypothetical protein D3C80_999090 [compost metagenome]
MHLIGQNAGARCLQKGDISAFPREHALYAMRFTEFCLQGVIGRVQVVQTGPE